MSIAKPLTGTREWAPKTISCIDGCEHRCRYCYARAAALQRKQIKDPEEWGTTFNSVNYSKLRRPHKMVAGLLMFPDTHDITPKFLPECVEMISSSLQAGNRLLIVSKPHLECFDMICCRFQHMCIRDQNKIMFRFTIGARSDDVLSYWEPGAPNFAERIACLQLAYDQGFATSVSIEPMLDSEDIEKLVNTVKPLVTETIWIGKMRDIRQRCIAGTSEVAMERIEEGQTDERIMEIYHTLKDEPKVRWKDSIKEVFRPAKKGEQLQI